MDRRQRLSQPSPAPSDEVRMGITSSAIWLPGEIISVNGKQFRGQSIQRLRVSIKLIQRSWAINCRNYIEKKGTGSTQASDTKTTPGKKQRKRWKNITTQESAEQVSSRAIWSTAAMKQVMPRTKVKLGQSVESRPYEV
ncbi:hypothetical protein Tco_1200740 [Tanacetum coccineum]